MYVIYFPVKSYIAHDSGCLEQKLRISDHMWDKHGSRNFLEDASKFIHPITRGDVVKMIMATELNLKASPRGLTCYLDQVVKLPFTVGSQGYLISAGAFSHFKLRTVSTYFNILFLFFQGPRR